MAILRGILTALPFVEGGGAISAVPMLYPLDYPVIPSGVSADCGGRWEKALELQHSTHPPLFTQSLRSGIVL